MLMRSRYACASVLRAVRLLGQAMRDDASGDAELLHRIIPPLGGGLEGLVLGCGAVDPQTLPGEASGSAGGNQVSPEAPAGPGLGGASPTNRPLLMTITKPNAVLTIGVARFPLRSRNEAPSGQRGLNQTGQNQEPSSARRNSNGKLRYSWAVDLVHSRLLDSSVPAGEGGAVGNGVAYSLGTKPG